ncbi:hypothetical protein Misp05_19490 [Micromonospora sp. NBRC 107095]|nr:hypothetical protein Misp05_19490 [Micromonospora sp. NBRC 107095]
MTAVATADEAFPGSNPLERVNARVVSMDFFPPLPSTALVEAGPPLHATSPRARVAAVDATANERSRRGGQRRLSFGSMVVLT